MAMGPISKNEIVARYIFGKGKTSNRKNEVIVHPGAFEPHRIRNDVSVSRISGIDERSKWFIGKIVEKLRKEKGGLSSLKGRADIETSKVQDLQLEIIPDEPPPKHANILGFPPFSKEPDSESFLIQQQLANEAKGFLCREVTPSIDDILSEDVAVREEFSAYLS